MKYLLTILLFISCATEAQTNRRGFYVYPTSNGSVQIMVHYPSDTSGSKKFATYIFDGGNGETDTASMFNVGVGRQFMLYPSLMPDSIIYVLIVPTSQIIVEQPNVLFAAFDAITAHTTHSDTTNWLYSGLSQGAINVVDAICWVYPPDGGFAGFGDNTNYRFNRIKKINVASICAQRSAIQFSRMNGKGFRAFAGSADATCAQSYTDQLYTDLTGAGAYGRKIIIAGGTHSNNVWDSAFSPRGDSSTNSYLWLLNQAGVAGPPSTTVTITPAQVYNMNNGNFKGGGYGDTLRKLFTGSTGLPIIPIPGAFNRLMRQGWTGAADSTWKPGRMGWGFVVDMIGDTNATNFARRDTIKYIKWQEQNAFNPNDSVFVYAIDTVIQNPNKAQGIQEFGRADSLITPIAILHFSDRTQWDSVSVANIPARYLFFRFTGHDLTGTYGIWTQARPLQMRIIGNLHSGTAPQFVTPTSVATHNIDSVTGINNSGIIDDTLLDGRKWIRQYDVVGRSFSQTRGGYDTSIVPLSANPKYTINGYADGSYILNLLARRKAAGSITLLSLRGTSNYLRTRQKGAGVDNGLPLTEGYQDPETLTYGSFPTYGRIAQLAKELARKTGRGTTTDSSHFVTGETSFPGLNRNTIDWLEIGNETNDGVHANTSPLAYFCMMKTVRDSVDLVDPSMKLMGQGTTCQDVEFWRSFYWHTQVWGDKNPLLDGVQYHNYLTRADDIYINALGQTAYHKGASPEYDSVYLVTQNFVKALKTIFPSTLVVICGEQGYEEGDSAIVINNPALTPFSTPRIQGMSVTDSRFTFMLRRAIVDAAAGLDATIEYTTFNPSYIDMTLYTTGAQNMATFAQMGMGYHGNQHMTDKVQAYYTSPFITKFLAGYRMDSAYVTGKDVANIYRFRKRSSPDSVKIIAYWGSDSLNTGHSVSIATNGFTASPSQTVPAMGLTANGTTTTAGTSGNNITATLNAVPKIFAFQETSGGGSPPSCTTNILPTPGSTVATTTTAALSWNAASGATSYDVFGPYIGGTPPGSPSYTGITGTTMTATLLTANSVYHYYVRPVNASGAATGCATNNTQFSTHAVVSSGKKLLIRR
jgi:hypothetical protein